MSRLGACWKMAGKIVLVAGLCYAPIHYIVQSRQAEERLGDLLPAYDKEMNREMRTQMGTLGLVLMQWRETLEQPGAQALLIAAGAAIVAKGCSYVAERVDEA